MSLIEAQKRGADLTESVMAALEFHEEQRPRTRQSADRIVGMSEMGGCREFLRATWAGDEKQPEIGVKWPAFVGTAVGDMIETIVQEMGFRTQEDVELVLERSGRRVPGHLDIRANDYAVVDLKTKDGLAHIRREGPSFKEKAQIAGYLVACIQMGKLQPGSSGHLMYFDRSGKEVWPEVWSVDHTTALSILAAVEERINDVETALETGQTQGYLRDEPRSWCQSVKCPFRKACWEGDVPPGKIDRPVEIKLVADYVAARAEAKEAERLRLERKELLLGIEGLATDGTQVKWTMSKTPSGGITEKLEVIEP